MSQYVILYESETVQVLFGTSHDDFQIAFSVQMAYIKNFVASPVLVHLNYRE